VRFDVAATPHDRPGIRNAIYTVGNVPSYMPDTVTPITPKGTSTGNKILDLVIALGAMVLLAPAIPILVLVWLVERLGSDDPDETE
jgi:hypothetical protein